MEEVDLDGSGGGEDWRGVGGGETTVRIYCMKNTYFQ